MRSDKRLWLCGYGYGYGYGWVDEVRDKLCRVDELRDKTMVVCKRSDTRLWLC
jgi:hypothetical protein